MSQIICQVCGPREATEDDMIFLDIKHGDSIMFHPCCHLCSHDYSFGEITKTTLGR